MTLRGRGILDTSIAISLFRYLCKWYRSLEQRISYMYHNSQTHRLAKGLWEKIKICFRYSFLGRITEIKEADSLALDNSRAVRYSINFYKRWKDEVIHYSKTSSTIKLAKDTKEELYFSSVKMISLIIIITILVNAILFVILQKQMELWSFLIRALFLFVGTAGLSCSADWPTVKKGSVFLRRIHLEQTKCAER